MSSGMHQAEGLGGAGRGRDDVRGGGARTAEVAVRAVLQVLVGGVGVDRGHQTALDAEVVEKHLGERREAVRGARGVREDVVHRAVVGLLVDAEDDRGDVVTGGRSRDDDLLGAAGDVLARILGLGEAAGGLDDDVDAQLAPRQVGRVALFEDVDRLAVDDDLVAVELDGRVETARDRVVLQKVRERLVVGEVVDGDDLEVAALGQSGAEEVTTNATEPVDSDLYGHRCLLLLRGAGRRTCLGDGNGTAVSRAATPGTPLPLRQ